MFLIVYLDTSALLKLYFMEDESAFVQKCIERQDEPLPVGWLQEAEFINACRLKVFWRDITAEQADSQIDLLRQRIRRGQYFVPHCGS